MAVSMGHAGQLGVAVTGAAVTQWYEFRSENFVKTMTHVETGGIRGTRSHLATNLNEGTYTVGGPVVLVPNYSDLVTLFPWILGAAAAGTTFALAETVPPRIIAIDRIAKVHWADGVKVNKAIFRSAKGQPLTLELDLQGEREGSYDNVSTFTETTLGAAASFPAATLTTPQPYMHHQGVLTLAGTTYEYDNMELTIDNALILDRFFNSKYRAELPEGDRIITLGVDLPYTSTETGLYNMAVAGVTSTLVYSFTTISTTFTFGLLQAPAKSPNIASRTGEIGLHLDLTARMTGATRELVVTHDSTV